MSSPKSIIVVAPGCPAEVIQELFDARILPAQTNFEVLCPPENNQQFGHLVDAKIFAGGEIFPSPARRFFSTRHLKWLWVNLRSSKTPYVLTTKSPYQDLTIAMVSLLTMLFSGKTTTLLRTTQENVSANPEYTIDLNGERGHGLTRNWLSTELNLDFLAKELGRIAWSFYPGFVKNLINYTERELFTYVKAYINSPVNFRPLDSSTEALQRDVERSLLLSDFYLNNLPDGVQLIQGKKVLEIGPGINLGPILTLACHGAKVAVADKFLTTWDSDYHPKFYALLRDRLINRWPSINLTPLDMVLSQGGYPSDIISLYSCSLEELWEVPDQSIEIVCSHSVLEHLYDLKSAFFHLARITKPGGLGLHMVDFRDHRDFSRPLEYLLLSNKEFSREFKVEHGEFGNRYRPQEMRRLLEHLGFEVRNPHPLSFIEEVYLADFLRRLREAHESRYRDYPAENLRLIAGFFVMVKNHTKTSTNIVRKKSFLSPFSGRLSQ